MKGGCGDKKAKVNKTAEERKENNKSRNSGTYVDDIYIPPPVTPFTHFKRNGPRLVIRNIEAFNFKNFVGKCQIGPLNHVSVFGNSKYLLFY